MKTYSYQQGSIEERVIQVAHYIIEHNATVRQAAGAFGVSKSTVHNKISQILCDSFCIGIYYEMIDNLTKEGGDVGCLLRITETKM